MLQAHKESARAPPVLTKAKDPPPDAANCPRRHRKTGKDYIGRTSLILV